MKIFEGPSCYKQLNMNCMRLSLSAVVLCFAVAPLCAQDVVKDIQARMKQDPGVVVDVRTRQEWNQGHHAKAIHADWTSGDLKRQAAGWDKNKTYYLYCAVGGRSAQAVKYLSDRGFRKVYNLGGYDRVKKLP
jgi:phage shock protein E